MVSLMIVLMALLRRMLRGLRPRSANASGGRVSAGERARLLQKMAEVNRSIESTYALIRQNPHGAEVETLYLERIYLLEDLRFKLLDQLNDGTLEAYNTLPLKVV
jgi:hypothetical protein